VVARHAGIGIASAVCWVGLAVEAMSIGAPGPGTLSNRRLGQVKPVGLRPAVVFRLLTQYPYVQPNRFNGGNGTGSLAL